MNSGILYIVGTPIGNLGDITYRAVETLEKVDVIACEDTRHSMKLLNHLKMNKPLVSYYKEKENIGSDKIIEFIKDGKSIALITDAGMPCISDPGSVLVNKCYESGIKVEVVPGPTAVASAYALSGELTNGFVFLGFLPNKVKDKAELLDDVKYVNKSLIFYVAPHDLKKELEYLYNNLGDRKVCVIKEMTKIHESVYKGNLSNILDMLEDIRGEYVVIVSPSKSKKDKDLQQLDPESLLKIYLNSDMTSKEAIKKASKELGMLKDDVYKVYLSLKNK